MSYSIRSRCELPACKRALIDLTTTGKGVPLKDQWNERWCSQPKEITTEYEKVYNFQVYEDDVFVVTFPKCGTTWIQEAAWLLLNDLDFTKAKEIALRERSIYLEFKACYPLSPRDTLKCAAELERPRLIKSHLHAHTIPHQIWEKKAKVIYCARNPKDVVVSYYHFHAITDGWKGTIDEFVNDIINDNLMYTPYWTHILDFWKMRHQPEIFFVTYEEMKRNLENVLIRLNEFLRRPKLEATKLKELCEHLSFERMKANEKTNPTKALALNRNGGNFNFMRRGIVGAYRDELQKELRNKLDEWTRKCLQGQNVTEEDIFETNLL